MDTGSAVDARSQCDVDRLLGPCGDAVFAVYHNRRKDFDDGGGRNGDGAWRRGLADGVGRLGQPTDVDGRHHVICIDAVFCVLPGAGSREPQLPQRLVVCCSLVRGCRPDLFFGSVFRHASHGMAGLA
jgi:hypothetical protein